MGSPQLALPLWTLLRKEGGYVYPTAVDEHEERAARKSENRIPYCIVSVRASAVRGRRTFSALAVRVRMGGR